MSGRDWELMEFLSLLWAMGVFNRNDPPKVAARKIMTYIKEREYLPRFDDLSREENHRFYDKVYEQFKRRMKEVSEE